MARATSRFCAPPPPRPLGRIPAMSPPSAAPLALAMALPGATGNGAVQGIASVWARTDPKAALDWSRQHPDTATRDSAAKTILTEWARQDPLAVGPMLLQKREGAADLFHTDAAAEAVARLSESSPEAAAKFVAEFYLPDQLKANLSSLFFRLMPQQSVEQSNLPVSQKTVLLNSILTPP